MSLDVYLYVPIAGAVAEPREAIFIREDGAAREITREEWDQRFPGRDPVTCLVGGVEIGEPSQVYHANITHNLTDMAGECGIFEHLWRPDELGITQAKQLIPAMEAAVAMMKKDPARFLAHNPPNGWGNYEGFLAFVEKYLDACRQWPDANVRVSG